MKYLGSKARISDQIVKIVQAERRPGQVYVEPFLGGANVIHKVSGERIAGDLSPYVATLWNAVANGWTPPQVVTESVYAKLKRDRWEDPLTAYAGFAMSFGGKFFGGYRRDKAGTKGCPENEKTQSRRSYNSMVKQASGMAGVRVFNCGYEDLPIPANSLIYCDPPYAGTTGYHVGPFDSAAFYKWAEDKVNEGHTVFVSEYTAPDHWDKVWEKPMNRTLCNNAGGRRGTERLFRVVPS
ncbi:DNA adenine methylase [Paracoccus sp. (in: a-proteobacteria)]|uniref:DNA adenine methylase n=1 Tax=Paracoccus sp. TaxID=267 RepID=UPI0026DF725C|nr:DNA adenine methylase [Paracoccus sp. (in: a-proteobacteria)]MDO5647354.1 DNA adenine methylase [Paracoccus sp. (in: a-proteobacteria)]